MSQEGSVTRRLKRVLIKEELVALTGDLYAAIFLSQLLYWTERCRDIDKFILEERSRFEGHDPSPASELTHGWIYKGAKELSDETMVGMAETSVRERLVKLVQMGVLQERSNPIHKWDRKKQYRLDLIQLKRLLNAHGYPLDGWQVVFPDDPSSPNEDATPVSDHAIPRSKHGSPKSANRDPRRRSAIPKTTAATPIKNTDQDHNDEKAVALLLKLKDMNEAEAALLVAQFGAYRIGKAVGIKDWMVFAGRFKPGSGPDQHRAWVIKAIKGDYPIPAEMTLGLNRRQHEWQDWKEERGDESDVNLSDFVIEGEIKAFFRRHDPDEMKRQFMASLKEQFLINHYQDADPHTHKGLRAAIYAAYRSSGS